MSKNNQQLLSQYARIYEQISTQYHRDRFSSRRGKYDYIESNEMVKRIIESSYLKSAEDNHNPLIVDVGCGTGKVSIPMAAMGFDVICLDASFGMLKQCNERAKVSNVEEKTHSLQASADFIPLGDCSVDIVVSSRFLHLFPFIDYMLLLTEMVRVTKPGGVIIVEVRNRYYGLILGIIDDLMRKLKKKGRSSLLSFSEIYKLEKSLCHVKMAGIYGCQLPKGQYFMDIPFLSKFYRLLANSMLKPFAFVFFLVFKKI